MNLPHWTRSFCDCVSCYSGELGQIAPAELPDDLAGANSEDEFALLLQQREDYVATLVHDLKVPLLAANRALRLLVDGDFGPVSAGQQEVMKLVIQSNETAYDLIRSVLDVYCYESGEMKISLAYENLMDLIAGVKGELSQLAGAKGIEISVLGLPRGTQMLCDGGKIQRVLRNLLDNAIKYTPAFGKIWIETRQSEQETEILVHDSGRGIAEEEQSELFQRFRQGSSDRTGTACSVLGLFLCRKIVEMHGGTINCESRLGVGTTFRVVIPAIPLPAAERIYELTKWSIPSRTTAS